MKNNKLICVVLALLVCLSLVISASATTENELTFALEPVGSSVENFDASVIGAGQEFTVQVVIESNPGITYVYADVTFDTAVLELVSVNAVVGNTKTVGNMVRFVIGDASAVNSSNVDVITTTGVIAELTFKVLAESDIKSAIVLECESSYAYDANCDRNTLTVNGDKANVNVVTEEHVCDENATVPANNAIAPTCTIAGKTTDILCAHCGKLVKAGEELAALGHTAGEVVVENEVAADCVNAGSYDNVTYCTVCGEEASRVNVVVEALGHTAGEVVVENEVAADCVTAGSYDNVTYCTVCTAEVTRVNVVVDALGHNAGAVVIENAVAADCVNDGGFDNVVYCTVCTTELSRESVVNKAMGHTTGKTVMENMVQASCTVDGGYDNVVYCSECDIELSREKQVLSAAGHPWNDGAITTEPGCETFGVRTYTCTKCGETKLDENVPAAGHAYGEFVVTTEPTTEAEGVETSICSKCGATETRSVAKLAPEPAPQSNTLVIVIAVVAVLAAAGVAAFFVLKSKKG